MRVLIVGASSLVAKYLYASAPCDVLMTYKTYCPCPAVFMDITNPAGMEPVFKRYKPDVVICCAAEGDVDTVEKQWNKKLKESTLEHLPAYQTNVEGVRNVVSMCGDNTKLVFLSTNAVFYGDKAPYKEKDERRAINRYGEIKILAENEAVQAANWLIIRPILLYGTPWINGRTNFVTRTVEKLLKKEKIQVVNDTVTQPTYAGDLADAIWRLITEKENSYIEVTDGSIKKFPLPRTKYTTNKIIHIASPEKTSLYNFALKIASVYGLDDRLIEPVPSDYFKTIAPRPVDTTYDLTKMTDLGIECMGICEGLTKMKEEK